jgi:mono/diheme cytochrome c family protein
MAGPASQEEVMRRALLVLGLLLLASFGVVAARHNIAQEKPKDAQAGSGDSKITQEDIDKKNPVKLTPEGLAEARRIYGYDCAMCHGEHGDGKGDLVESMKLKMSDWRNPGALEGKTDGEIFYIIGKGKGKMPGEADRVKEPVLWNLVNLVRSFAKKEAADKPAT